MTDVPKKIAEHRKTCRREDDERRARERRLHDQPTDPDRRTNAERRAELRRSDGDRRDKTKD